MASSTPRALPIEIETAGGDELPATRIRVIPSIDPRSRTFVTILTVIDRDGVLALESKLAAMDDSAFKVTNTLARTYLLFIQ